MIVRDSPVASQYRNPSRKVLGGHGLGLISMRERVRFVNGEISIQSTPNGGTTIEVVVPLPADTVKAESA